MPRLPTATAMRLPRNLSAGTPNPFRIPRIEAFRSSSFGRPGRVGSEVKAGKRKMTVGFLIHRMKLTALRLTFVKPGVSVSLSIHRPRPLLN